MFVFLSLVKNDAMKKYRGVEVLIHIFLTFAVDENERREQYLAPCRESNHNISHVQLGARRYTDWTN
jgi:hypothetical protein